MRRGAAALSLFLLPVLFALTGCWDVRDISDRTPALAVGFDRTAEGRWRVTLGEVLPEGGESARYDTNIQYGEGDRLEEAVDDLRTHTTRRVYLGATGTFVFGSGVTHRDMTGVLLYLLQRREVSKSSFLAATTGTAEQLLTQRDGAMGAMAVRLEREFETQDALRDGYIPVMLWQVTSRFFTPGAAFFLPVFDPLPVHGAAARGELIIGADHRQVLLLSRTESVTLRWFLNTPARSRLPLPDGTSVKLIRTRQTTRVIGGVPPSVRVTIRAAVEAYSKPNQTITLPRRREIEALTARVMADRAVALIQKLKAVGADVPLWVERADQAGVPQFDFSRCPVWITTHVRLIPKEGPTP